MYRMCQLAGVSRAGYYRHWRASEPGREEAELSDAIQRLALAPRHYGYRRIGALLRREGWCVNHKRVNRLMREDNLLCLRRRAFVPATTDSGHRFRVWPNLARRLEPMAVNQLWVADITYVRLERGRLSGGDHRLVQPQGADLAVDQHSGWGILYRLSRRSPTALR